jgi:hypothetical protein
MRKRATSTPSRIATGGSSRKELLELLGRSADYAWHTQLSQQVQPPQCPAELQEHLSIAFTRCF